jgi:hypothetical protein
VIAVAANPASGFEAMEAAFPRGSSRRRAVAAFHGVQEEDPALDALLVAAAMYELDPILGGLQLLPDSQRGTDGAEGSSTLKPHAGRDVLLTIARRTEGYKGLKFGVRCKGDKFTLKWTGKPGDPQLRHEYAPEADDEDPAEHRGAILGAWARLLIDGQADTFHYVPLHEKDREDSSRFWRDYKTEMILKAAQSYVCRIGCGITGIVPSDEIALSANRGGGGKPEQVSAETFDVDFGQDAELRRRLVEAIDRANALTPNSWTEAKAQMVLNSRTDEDREKIAGDIENEVEAMERAAALNAAGELPAPEPLPSDLVENVKASELAEGDVIRVGMGALTIAGIDRNDAGDIVIRHGDEQLDPVKPDAPFARRRRSKNGGSEQ